MAINWQIVTLGEFARMGFSLVHPDDHAVILFHEGHRISTFCQAGATEESIQAECLRHLAAKHGWDGCIWKR